MGDANSAYSLDDIDLFKRMDAFRFDDVRTAAARTTICSTTRNCNGKSKRRFVWTNPIRSPEDARKAIELEAREKSSTSSSVASADTRRQSSPKKFAAKRTFPSGAAECWNRASAERTISPCQLLQGFTLPGDVSASKRYWHEDIIEPEVEVTAGGTIIAPAAAGIGFEVRRARIDKLARRRTEIKS